MSRLSQWAKTEKEKISNIPENGKRAAYIWEYYKLWIIGIVFLIWLVAFSIHQYTTTMHDYWCYMMFNNTYVDAGDGSDIWEDYVEYKQGRENLYGIYHAEVVMAKLLELNAANVAASYKEIAFDATKVELK